MGDGGATALAAALTRLQALATLDLWCAPAARAGAHRRARIDPAGAPTVRGAL